MDTSALVAAPAAPQVTATVTITVPAKSAPAKPSSRTNLQRPRNRRGSMRKKPKNTVKVECRRGYCGLGPNLNTEFLDVSEGGVRLILSAQLELKQETEVLITCFGLRKPIKRLANVCWSVPLEDGRFCVGLEFQKRLQFRDLMQFAKP